MWNGSFNGRESTLHQLSPYIGKLKTGMANAIIERFSQPGDIVLDMFSGSGVVPLESALLGRIAWANDLSPYAYTLTRGKLEAPKNIDTALDQSEELFCYIEENVGAVDLRKIPKWVRAFFHKETLREIVLAFEKLRADDNYFLLSCLLGILHHQRPGFLSYPSSHLVPYLRDKKFPREEFPDLYEYRELRSRLVSKVKRAYRKSKLPDDWEVKTHNIWNTDSKHLLIDDVSIDSIISSPPYFGALSYARDNRLRLWFLGEENWQNVENSLISKHSEYLFEMRTCLLEMYRVLKPERYCVLVLGDVEKNGKTNNTAQIIAREASDVSEGGFIVDGVYSDRIPNKRRSRRKTKTTKVERILVMKKRG